MREHKASEFDKNIKNGSRSALSQNRAHVGSPDQKVTDGLTYEDKVGAGGEGEAGGRGCAEVAAAAVALEPLVQQLQLPHLAAAVGPGGCQAQSTVYTR